jgi:hypothetical protein
VEQAVPAWTIETVTVGVASRNTRRATELALRTIRASCSAPIWVGDCESTDGSQEMLRRLRAQGVIQRLDVVAERSHGEWIDHWRREVPTPLLVVADSDIELHRRGWAEEMVQVLRQRGHGLVSVGAREGGRFTEPNTFSMRTVARPEMYLMLLDREATAQVDTSFGFTLEQAADGDWTAWDTGAAFAHRLAQLGIGWSTMPEGFASAVTHWGALSYMTDDERLPQSRRGRARVRLRRAALELRVARRLRRARRGASF